MFVSGRDILKVKYLYYFQCQQLKCRKLLSGFEMKIIFNSFNFPFFYPTDHWLIDIWMKQILLVFVSCLLVGAGWAFSAHSQSAAGSHVVAGEALCHCSCHCGNVHCSHCYHCGNAHCFLWHIFCVWRGICAFSLIAYDSRSTTTISYFD